MTRVKQWENTKVQINNLYNFLYSKLHDCSLIYVRKIGTYPERDIFDKKLN